MQKRRDARTAARIDRLDDHGVPEPLGGSLGFVGGGNDVVVRHGQATGAQDLGRADLAARSSTSRWIEV